MNVADARQAYQEAREIASAAFHAVYDRAAARNAKTMRAARTSGTQLTREEVSAYVIAITEAPKVYEEIMACPTADLDEALAEAKKERQ